LVNVWRSNGPHNSRNNSVGGVEQTQETDDFEELAIQCEMIN